jgi:threonine synthase
MRFLVGAAASAASEGHGMDYLSTRGAAPLLGFTDVLLAGLARDGGLYLPREWPRLNADQIRGMRRLNYLGIADAVLTPFIGEEIDAVTRSDIITEAYATFRHPAICPLLQTGPGEWVLELFHGPTLAFKDVAMQLLARLMDHVLTAQDRRATIVGATSGDTGGAAIEAFAGRDRSDIFILFPNGRVSPVQQRQMTTSNAANVHAIAIEGTFDDCQAIVKALFNNHEFRDRYALSGVNSINWARIMAQIVYYFSAAIELGAPDRSVEFVVPTGNFGNVFAGYAAQKMGLPIRLKIATNENDILARAIRIGEYATRAVVPTTSPSMDIQVSSNFERLLFEAVGRKSETVGQLMAELRDTGSFSIREEPRAWIEERIGARSASSAEAAAEIRAMLASAGYLLDPHTAVGYAAWGARGSGAEVGAAVEGPESGPKGRAASPYPDPRVFLATAHPAKFPDAVEAACGVRPELPTWLSDLMQREERYTVLPNAAKMVEEYVSRHTRAGS